MTDTEAMDKIQQTYSAYREVVEAGAERPSDFAKQMFSIFESILKLTGREG